MQMSESNLAFLLSFRKLLLFVLLSFVQDKRPTHLTLKSTETENDFFYTFRPTRVSNMGIPNGTQRQRV